MEIKVSKDQPDSKVLLVDRVTMVTKEQLVLMVTKVIKDQLGLPENRVTKVPLV